MDLLISSILDNNNNNNNNSERNWSNVMFRPLLYMAETWRIRKLERKYWKSFESGAGEEWKK